MTVESTPFAHPTWKFARYLVGYRGNLTRAEAARRSGLPEALWEKVEVTPPSEQGADLIPAGIVASMCITVGADIATGLTLAGHRLDMFPHLIERPPTFSPPIRGAYTSTGPHIATPHIICEALAGDPDGLERRMASVFRLLARSNWDTANRITQEQATDETEFWRGYAAAVRAVAEQQAWAADQEDSRNDAV